MSRNLVSTRIAFLLSHDFSHLERFDSIRARIFTNYENPDVLSPSAKNIEVLGVFAGGFAARKHPKPLLCDSRAVGAGFSHP
jgi:hypothetical protein